jgi:hypothetical protein
LSKSFFPVNKFKLVDLDQSLALFAGALAALLSLKEVIEKRDLVRRARAWIKRHHRCSASSRNGNGRDIDGTTCSKYEVL